MKEEVKEITLTLEEIEEHKRVVNRKLHRVEQKLSKATDHFDIGYFSGKRAGMSEMLDLLDELHRGEYKKRMERRKREVIKSIIRDKRSK